MRRLSQLSLVLGLLLWGPSAYAQSVRYQSQAISSRGAGIANATIAVCGQPANTNTQPCSPLATLATSTSTTSGGANPLTADSFGNFFFYAAPGRYTVQIYGPAVFGQLVTPDIEVASTGGGAAGLFSTISAYGLNQIQVIDGCTGLVATPHYACSDVGLQAAQNALPSGGEIWITSNGVTLSISNPVNITNPYIRIHCAGANTGITVNNIGDVFNVTNSNFQFSDCRVAFSQTGTRTGAVIHANSSNASNGFVNNLFVTGNAGATNNGIFFLADAPGITTWQLNFIQMPRGSTWNSAFKFVSNSGSQTVTQFNIIQYKGGASFTDAALIADGAVDTVQTTGSSFNNDSASGKTFHIRNTVAGFINPRWIYFDQVSCESTTTSTCLQVDAGRQVHYYNGYIAASQIATVVGASSVDFDFSHNTVATIQQNVGTVANGAVNTTYSYNSVNDASQQTANTYDVYSVAANTTDVSIIGNQYRCTPTIVTFRNGVNFISGTGTRLKAINNNFPSQCIGTAATSSGATGTDVQLYGNGDLANANSRFFLGAGEISLGETTGVTNLTAGQDNCAGNSTVHMPECSYNGNTLFPIPQTGNTAGTHSDSGFYQTATAAGCTTPASIGGVCATPITITWPVAFADANYKVTCTPSGAATNLPSAPYLVTPIAASATVNYFAITAAAASWPNVTCTAVHN